MWKAQAFDYEYVIAFSQYPNLKVPEPCLLDYEINLLSSLTTFLSPLQRKSSLPWANLGQTTHVEPPHKTKMNRHKQKIQPTKNEFLERHQN
jgi:hypothetical protein